MENAVDALKLAAAILIFVIALSASFSVFGTAKQTADSIITMRDKQAYLESADLNNGILYTSYSDIKGDIEEVAGVTPNGDRVVEISDVFSTIYRYPKEKYGVTLITEGGEVKARFDVTTESIMKSWDRQKEDENGNLIYAITDEEKENYIEKLKEHIGNYYLKGVVQIDLEGLYESKTKNVYAPWGTLKEINQRIGVDINGGTFENGSGIVYEGISIISYIQGKKIIEITKEIDNTTYLKDGEAETSLAQKYNMPTVEIIYVILD